MLALVALRCVSAPLLVGFQVRTTSAICLRIDEVMY